LKNQCNRVQAAFGKNQRRFFIACCFIKNG
jgi:hypothetical protein